MKFDYFSQRRTLLDQQEYEKRLKDQYRMGFVSGLGTAILIASLVAGIFLN